jgi:hypothetical protein
MRESIDADEILSQLTGGTKNPTGRLSAMIGAKNFVKSDAGNWVMFKYPRGKYVKIKLTGRDLYDMEFGTIRGINSKVTKEFKGLYNDMLKKTFEDYTKLYLSL